MTSNRFPASPYQRTFDFKLGFEEFSDGHRASFTREVGVVFGAYDLSVIELNPICVRATADTVLSDVPKLVPEESGSLTHLFSGGCAQPSNSQYHLLGLLYG